MKSFQIRKWQDNYADICSKEKDRDENVVNAILECANQLAEINEKLFDKHEAVNLQVCLSGEVSNIQLKDLKSKYKKAKDELKKYRKEKDYIQKLKSLFWI